MKFGKISVVAFLAVGAVGIAAGTASAEPGPAHQNGIHYRVAVSPVTEAITTTVDAGRFVAAADGSSVALESDTGATVDRISLRENVAGHVFTASRQISRDGRSLTLTPQVSAQDVAQLKDINSFDNLTYQVNRNLAGVVIGGILGATVGSLLGIGIFTLITGPLLGLLGAIGGGYIQGGPAFLGAVQDFAAGRP